MDEATGALTALGSGLLASSTLLIGAAIAWFFKVSDAVVAGILAFGAGVLISTLAYDLVLEAYETGGLWPTVFGFALGALIYVGADAIVDARGRRKGADEKTGGSSLLVGALVDTIPESVVLGTTIAATGAVSMPVLVGVAIANFPEGLAGSAAMKESGRSAKFIFGVWGAVVLVSGIASLLGYVLLRDAAPELIAFITATAAGGLLAMVCNTMIPTAFKTDRAATALLATFGFLAAFIFSHLG